MDRKSCIIFYSNYSQHSLDLINFIQKIPLDFVTLVGMSFIAVDNNEYRNILQQQNITIVPTLVVTYYNGENKFFEDISIYTWIREILHSISHTENENLGAESATGRDTTEYENQKERENSMLSPTVSGPRYTRAKPELKRTQLHLNNDNIRSTRPSAENGQTHPNEQNSVLTTTGTTDPNTKSVTPGLNIEEPEVKKKEKKDITSLAMEIQKSREADLKQIHPQT